MEHTSFFVADDKYIPLYRVMWLASLPHFCGHEECEREGQYEIRLEQGEAIWCSLHERDGLLKALEDWTSGGEPPIEGEWDKDEEGE